MICWKVKSQCYEHAAFLSFLSRLPSSQHLTALGISLQFFVFSGVKWHRLTSYTKFSMLSAFWDVRFASFMRYSTCSDCQCLFLFVLLLRRSQSSERLDFMPETFPLDVWFSQCVSEPPGWSTCQYFSWQKQSVVNQPRITHITPRWNNWTILPSTHFQLKDHLACPPTSTSTSTADPDPVVKPCFLYLRDSRAPSALCHIESNTSWAAEISRQLVFHWSFVFVILLCFRLSCRTLRCVLALKCD